MTSSCEHLEEFKQKNLSEYSCLYSCLIACNSKKALKTKATHSICCTCKQFSWNLHACLFCVFIGCYEEKHIHQHMYENEHCLSVDLSHGFVYCIICGDFVYDTDLDKIAMKCKRKSCELLGIPEPYYPWVPSDSEIELLQKSTKRKYVLEDSYIGIRGLCNLGNTCYINVILQTMLHMPIMREYFLSLQHLCNPENLSLEQIVEGKPDCILCELSLLFQEFYSGKSQVFSPCRIFSYIWDRCKEIRSQRQVDAHELLGVLLECMETNDKKNGVSDHKSIIDLVFNGRLQSDITCQVCKKVSPKVEPFYNISLEIFNLPLTDSGSSTVNGNACDISLQHCFERFTSKEDFESIYCDGCKMNMKCTKQLTFKVLPNVLCLHLKRFKQYVKGKTKLQIKTTTFVSFPEMLDMTQFLYCYHKEMSMENGNPPSLHSWYRLFAVVCHRGENIDDGHYTAYIRQCGNQWFECNDHTITLIDIEQVLKLQGYMLFYHKETLKYQ